MAASSTNYTTPTLTSTDYAQTTLNSTNWVAEDDDVSYTMLLESGYSTLIENGFVLGLE